MRLRLLFAAIPTCTLAATLALSGAANAQDNQPSNQQNDQNQATGSDQNQSNDQPSNDQQSSPTAAKQYGALGVLLDPYSSVQSDPGVRVSGIYKEGPADKAGIKTGDRILKLNGEEVKSLVELKTRISQLDANKKAKLVVFSEGKERQVEATIAPRDKAMKGEVQSSSAYDGNEQNDQQSNSNSKQRNDSSERSNSGDAKTNKNQTNKNQNARNQQGPTIQKALVMKLRKCNEAEIELAKMAQQKSDNQEVKDFTQTIIDDHKSLNDQLNKVNQGASNKQAARVPQQLCDLVDKAGQNALQMTKEMMQNKQGQNFNMAYLGQQIVSHTMLLAELKAIQNTGPQELNEVANQAIGKVESHLKTAKDLAKKLEDDEKVNSEG